MQILVVPMLQDIICAMVRPRSFWPYSKLKIHCSLQDPIFLALKLMNSYFNLEPMSAILHLSILRSKPLFTSGSFSYKLKVQVPVKVLFPTIPDILASLSLPIKLYPLLTQTLYYKRAIYACLYPSPA